jgi:hypothetical protein
MTGMVVRRAMLRREISPPEKDRFKRIRKTLKESPIASLNSFTRINPSGHPVETLAPPSTESIAALI